MVILASGSQQFEFICDSCGGRGGIDTYEGGGVGGEE